MLDILQEKNKIYDFKESYELNTPIENEVTENNYVDIQNERHIIWRKNTPFLYSSLLKHKLDWPSLTVEFLGGDNSFKSKLNYFTNKVLLGTHTSNQDLEYVYIGEIKCPIFSIKEDVLQYENYSGFISNKKKKKGHPLPSFEVKAKLLHPGEVIRATNLPSNSFFIVTQTSNGNALLFDYTKHPSFPSDMSTCYPQMILKGHTNEGSGLCWNVNRVYDSYKNPNIFDGYMEKVLYTGKEDDSIKDIYSVKDMYSLKDTFSLKDTNSVEDIASSKDIQSVRGAYSIKELEAHNDLDIVNDLDTEESNDSISNSNTFGTEVNTTNLLLASCSVDGSICLWDINKGTKSNDVPRTYGLNKSGKTADYNIKIYENTPTLSPLCTWYNKNTKTAFNDIFFHPKFSNALGVCDDNGYMSIYDIRKKNFFTKSEICFNDYNEPMNTFSFDNFSEYIFSCGYSDGLISVWDMRYNKESLLKLKYHTQGINRIKFGMISSGIFASCSDDGTACIWDISRNNNTQILPLQKTEDDIYNNPNPVPKQLLFVHGGHIGSIYDLAWANSNTFTIATVGVDNSIHVWHLNEQFLFQ